MEVALITGFVLGAAVTWMFASGYYREKAAHLKTKIAALENELFNIKEAKQIYDQFRLLIPPMKKHKRKR